MTVEQFPVKDQPLPKVWVCECGNEGFWLYQDGRIECMECNTFHTTMTGYWKVIDPEGPIVIRERLTDAVTNQERQEDSAG